MDTIHLIVNPSGMDACATSSARGGGDGRSHSRRSLRRSSCPATDVIGFGVPLITSDDRLPGHVDIVVLVHQVTTQAVRNVTLKLCLDQMHALAADSLAHGATGQVLEGCGAGCGGGRNEKNVRINLFNLLRTNVNVINLRKWKGERDREKERKRDRGNINMDRK